MTTRLPESEKLNISDLQRIFDDKSECYKLFWFKAILTKVKDYKQKITYNELICLMMADAYYMVNEYHLNLGPNDSLEKIVKIISNQTGVKTTEKAQKIYQMLLDYRSKEITKLRSNLITNLPYCLQSSFLEEKKISNISTRNDQRIHELNQQSRLLYYYSEYMQFNTEIIIGDEWFKYLCLNREILEGWVQYNLIEYLQKRNPTIPGIPNKIAPPEKRDLKYAKAFWQAIIQREDIIDCYTEKVLCEDNFKELGRMEIDHFIPWSYIASDEVWNLTPTFKSINGDKSNKLPDINVDLQKMAYQHHSALKIAAENSQVRKLLKTYLDNNLNDSATRADLYTIAIPEKSYEHGIHKIIEPLYLSAQNAGYESWKNSINEKDWSQYGRNS